jgi:glucans biosynthesis protein
VVRQSFGGHGAWGRRRRFLVEFVGDVFADPGRSGDPKAAISVSPGTAFPPQTYLSRSAKTFRVVFDIDPGGEQYAEMRLVVENAGKPISETWLYRWTP